MNTMTTAVDTITPIQGEEARRIATTEYRRMTDLLRSVERDDWSRPTPCEGWTVRDLLGHLVGALQQYASFGHAARLQTRAGASLGSVASATSTAGPPGRSRSGRTPPSRN